MAAEIRRATARDLPQLAQLFDAYRQIYKQPSDPQVVLEFLTERMARSQSILLLAEGPSGPCAFCQLYPGFSSVRAEPILILNDLFVEPEARRSGVAVRLLGEAANLARTMGVRRLTLETGTGNAAARALYERVGWREDRGTAIYALEVSAGS